METASYETLDIRDCCYAHWILSEVKRGEVAASTRGFSERALPGVVMIHPPGISFSEFAVNPGTHHWLACSASLGATAHQGFFQANPFPLAISLGRNVDDYEQIFECLETGWNSDAPGREMRCMGLFSQLLALLVDVWSEAGSPERPKELSPPEERFAEIIHFMEANLDRKITREQLADLACLHPNSLDRAFRSQFSMPPMQLLQTLRLTRVRNLLETTNETLDSIAISAGLSDASRLSHLFRDKFGVSPGAFREGVRATKRDYLSQFATRKNS